MKLNTLIVGDPSRIQMLRSRLPDSHFTVSISDGDAEEDFDEYQLIFDLNFDDDHENLPTYAELKNTVVFLSNAKQSIAEAIYLYDSKVKSTLVGINALPNYLSDPTLELSLLRPFEKEKVQKVIDHISKNILWVDDRVGLVRPRCQYLYLNEISRCIEQQLIHLPTDDPAYIQWVQQIDHWNITAIFETLMAIYEDTQDPRYFPTPILKKKYLRGHQFIHNS